MSLPEKLQIRIVINFRGYDPSNCEVFVDAYYQDNQIAQADGYSLESALDSLNPKIEKFFMELQGLGRNR